MGLDFTPDLVGDKEKGFTSLKSPQYPGTSPFCRAVLNDCIHSLGLFEGGCKG